MGVTSQWRAPPNWAWLRRATFARWGHVCWRCGGEGADSVGHVIPVALGGTHDLSNLRPEHSRENSSAGASLGNRLRPRRPLTGRQRSAIALKSRPYGRW